MLLPGAIARQAWLATFVAVGLLVFVACGGGSDEATPTAEAPATSPSPTAAAQPIIRMIPSVKFDKNELAIAADTDVTVIVNNIDKGVTHSFAVYESRADAEAGGPPLAETDVCAGPCRHRVTLNLAPGEYFFRCEVYPQKMSGRLIVR